MSGLPYFKFLKKETRDQHHEMQATDFAVLQREALENYLIGLIRSVVCQYNRSVGKNVEYLFIWLLDVSPSVEQTSRILRD